MKKQLLFLFAALLSVVAARAQGEDMLSTPLTLEAIEAGTVMFRNQATGPVIYRVNGGETYTIESNRNRRITVVAGDRISFYGNNEYYGKEEPESNILPCIRCSSDCYVYGNIMSLISSTDFANTKTLSANYAFADFFRGNSYLKNHSTKTLELPATTLAQGCYNGMFGSCTGLTIAPELPATILAKSCYSDMFNGCAGLTEAPKLPATTLSESCYCQMFYGCTGLTVAPELPVTTLAESCYKGMFEGCTGLTKAPELPVTTLAESCYKGMFEGCTGLTKAPELPAKTLATSCYHDMFGGCSGLTKAPELPATTLAGHCYSGMFAGCKGLIEAPELPATTLASNCYNGMFWGCTGISKAPELPAMTLVDSCYYCMFAACTGLTEAPELHATTLAERCYLYMFWGCTGLTAAPVLPATTLATQCYNGMFRDCTNLSSVTCLATDISAAGATSIWMDGVSATGTFYKHDDMKDWPTGASGIPEGWTVVDYDMTGISTKTADTKKTPTTSYDLRGIKSTTEMKGLKVVSGKKILTR